MLPNLCTTTLITHLGTPHPCPPVLPWPYACFPSVVSLTNWTSLRTSKYSTDMSAPSVQYSVRRLPHTTPLKHEHYEDAASITQACLKTCWPWWPTYYQWSTTRIISHKCLEFHFSIVQWTVVDPACLCVLHHNYGAKNALMYSDDAIKQFVCNIK